MRTDVLIRAFESWGFRVAVACAMPKTHNAHAARLESTHGAATIELPLNSSEALRTTVEVTEPDVAVFDRFYSEEQFSFGVKKLRPNVLRILDMQDSHALRLSRQRCVMQQGGSIMDALHAFPNAGDAALSRELASIWRSDLTLACSPVEARWLHEVCGVPASKLALAPLFYKAAATASARGNDATTPLPFEERYGFISLGTFRQYALFTFDEER